MAFLDNLRNAMRPYGDDEEYIENEGELETPVEEEPEEEVEEYAPKAKSNLFTRREQKTYTPNPAPAQNSGATQMFIFEKPKTMTEAAELVDRLKMSPVMINVNLESCDRDSERRIIDFLSGSLYALGGKIVRSGAHAFVLTPPNVKVMGIDIDDIFGATSEF